MKKLYALLMSCALVFSGSYITALAENETEPQTEEPEEVIEEVAETAEEIVTADAGVSEDAEEAVTEVTEETELLEAGEDKTFTLHFKCGGPYQPQKDEQYDLVVDPAGDQVFPENTFASFDKIKFTFDANGGTVDGTDIKEVNLPYVFNRWMIRMPDKTLKFFAAGEKIPADLAAAGETLDVEAKFYSEVEFPEAVRFGFNNVGWENQFKEVRKPGEKIHEDLGMYYTALWEGKNVQFDTGADGKSYWFEDGVKQGTADDPKGVVGDDTVRGREIYDPVTNEWYWLDAVYDGAKAVGKEVWMPYVYQNEDSWTAEEKAKLASESDEGMADLVLTEMNEKHGKWVRYDENGAMLKGWVTISGDLAEHYPDQRGKTYYYDTRTGIMARGTITIGGVTHHFDEITGELLDN